MISGGFGLNRMVEDCSSHECITPDGQHFVILTRGGAETTDDDTPPTLVVVQNWLAEH